MTETNCMGLDKFQLAIIKGNYTSLKPIIAKKAKLQEKLTATSKKLEEAIKALQEKTAASLQDTIKEIEVYQEQINALDNITKTHTKRSCGLELTSEQVMEFLKDTVAFEEYRKSIMGESLFPQESSETRDLDAEEDKEWEDRIASGELKEAV